VTHLFRFVRSTLVVATAMSASACAASSPPPPPPPQPPPQALAYPSTPPPASPGVYSANASSNALVSPLNAAPSNGTAPPIDPALAGAASAILDKFAGSLAPGMSREGSPMAATFQTGQTMEQVIPLQTGRCYTVVAAGPTVQAWDFSLILVANPLPVTPVLAHEAQTGTPAALAGNGNCFKWTWLPAQARVVVQVTQGGGIAVAQVYGK
jgi:hypothetical protein